MKVSKVVAIVVALHVLVIGGIFIFEGCSRAKPSVPDLAQGPADETSTNTGVASATPDQSAPMTPGASMTPVAPQPVTPVAPVAPATPVAAVPPVHATTTYVVKKSDTLYKIAKAEHVTIGELARANNLTKTSLLKVNQKLVIPTKTEAASTQTASASTGSSAVPADATAPMAAGGNVYIVKSGDSLWKIAKAQNISVASLKQANNLTSDALKVNQKLTLPAASSVPAAAAAASGAQASATPASYGAWQPGDAAQKIHIVDNNETPTVIARKYGVTVDDLLKANNISSGKTITVGMKLVIPGASAPVAASSATPAMAAPIVSANN